MLEKLPAWQENNHGGRACVPSFTMMCAIEHMGGARAAPGGFKERLTESR